IFYGAGWHRITALSGKAHFKGKASVLLVFRKNRVVDVRVLESNLSSDVTTRLEESLMSLNGHPIADFPKSKQYDQIPVIVTFSYQSDQDRLNHGCLPGDLSQSSIPLRPLSSLLK
ncbi:MAG: hypothetical protein K2Z81_00250, partial [Cyanobacteria bacterium]|nr:hypothetical protein [Cyanobacteriota bacterium]